MKINFTRGILLGVGLIGATTVITSAEAAPRDEQRRDVKEARKDVKDAKKDVKEERRDLRKADTPRERLEARKNLEDAQRDLRKEQRDLKDEKQDLRRPGGYNNGNRPNYNNGNRPNYNNGNRPNYNNGNRPNYNNGNYNNGYRPGNVYRPGSNNGYRPGSTYNNTTTIEGRVVNDLNNNGVILRPTNGANLRVTFSGGEPRRIDKGDLIRVTGYRDGGTFVARSVTILRNN